MDKESVMKGSYRSADIARLETKIGKILHLLADFESIKMENDTSQLKVSSGFREEEITELKSKVTDTSTLAANNTEKLKSLQQQSDNLNAETSTLNLDKRRKCDL